jgi:predicted transcriptional regulator
VKRLWSPNRPQRPARDPLLAQVTALLERDRRTTWELADDSGLSPSTIRNWERGKVRNPQSVSLQMAARSLGKRLVLK